MHTKENLCTKAKAICTIENVATAQQVAKQESHFLFYS